MNKAPNPGSAAEPQLPQQQDFSLERLLSRIDPSPAAVSEAFVRDIYSQRHADDTLDNNSQPDR